MPDTFVRDAQTLVDQHYAAGPDRMKEVIAEALRAAATKHAGAGGDPREALKHELETLESASERGSE